MILLLIYIFFPNTVIDLLGDGLFGLNFKMVIFFLLVVWALLLTATFKRFYGSDFTRQLVQTLSISVFLFVFLVIYSAVIFLTCYVFGYETIFTAIIIAAILLFLVLFLLWSFVPHNWVIIIVSFINILLLKEIILFLPDTITRNLEVFSAVFDVFLLLLFCCSAFLFVFNWPVRSGDGPKMDPKLTP